MARRRKRNGNNPNNPNEQNKQNPQQSGGQPQNNQKPQNGQNGQNQRRDQNKRNKNGNHGNQNGQNGGNNKKNRAEENRKDTYVYELDGKLYINLTNRCSNGCDFCVRNERTTYFGHHLWIRHGDPTADKVISAINGMGNLDKYAEVVFCGFGEPTYKMDELCAVAEYAKAKGKKTRLNTNGQGNLINKQDIVPMLKDKIDEVSISLNAPDAESYQKICRSTFGTNGFDALIEFAKACKRSGVPCRFTVVDYIGEDAIASCKKLASSVGVPIVVRKYIAEC